MQSKVIHLRPSETESIADHIDDFIAALERMPKDFSKNTLKAYRSDLALAGAALTQPLDTITAGDIERFLTSGGVTPSTAQRRAASLNRFFRWAVRERICGHNPVDLIESTTTTRRLPRPIRSATERERLDTAIAQAPQPHRLIFTILRETGMRVSEVLALELGDVQLGVGQEGLHVREAKNNHERIVILGANATPKTLRQLRALLKKRAREPLYTPLIRNKRGGRMGYTTVVYQWKKICARAKLVDETGDPRYTIHQLRHTRGTELFEDGIGVEHVQRILGHRDIRSTLGYAELDDAQTRQQLERAGKPRSRRPESDTR